jgi:hypothetical protein
MASAAKMIGGDHKKIAARIVQIPGTLGTIMHSVALSVFGPEIYEWEPETIAMEFQDELGVYPYESNLDKLNAILSGVSSDAFYKDWVAFVSICSVLSGENDPEEIYDLTPYELAWGCVEMALNDEDYSKSLFSDDIKTLVGVVLDEEGLVKPPSYLSFAKLPERYMGSTYGPEINNEVRYSEHASNLMTEYLQSQVVTLYNQMTVLPWLDENDIRAALSQAKEIISLS